MENEKCLEENKDQVLNELVECLDFFHGENKISIKLYKRRHRLYRTQIFLNDTIEIKPLTYNSEHVAYNFWDLLIQSLK